MLCVLLNGWTNAQAGIIAKTRGDSLLLYEIGDLRSFDFRAYKEYFNDNEDRVFSGELISSILSTNVGDVYLRTDDRAFEIYISSSALQSTFILDSSRIEGTIGALDRQIVVPIRLTNSAVTGRIEFTRCELSKSISIYNTTVDEGIFISACEANEDITFSFVISPRLDVRDFISNKSINLFEGKLPFINLQSIKVAQNVSLQVVQSKDISSKRSQISGDFTITSNDTAIQNLDISFSHISGNLYVNTAICTSMSMRSIRCESPAQIGIRQFVQELDLKGSMLKELLIYGEFRGYDTATIANVNMARCTTLNECKFDKLVISDLRAEHSVWRGETYFVKSSFTNYLYFRNSSFSNLVFHKCMLPDRDSIDFSEAKYEILPFNTEWRSPYWIAESTTFRPSVYIGLENYFKESGDLDRADSVFVLRMNRAAIGRNVYQRFGNWLFYWTLGYGRYWWRSLMFGIGIFAFGCLFFRRSNMIPIGDNNPDHRYNLIGFAVESFLPVVNLRIVDFWLPRKAVPADSKWRKLELKVAYLMCKLLPIVGFILVTVIAAVIAGTVVKD